MSLSTVLTPFPSLADRAFDAIVDAISHGHIAPGSRIKEAEIARNLGISRGPLREALRRLESQRIVERKQNLGAYVTGLSEQGLNDLFDMREALEGAACGLAAQRMSDEKLAELTAMFERHADQTVSQGEYVQSSKDDDFHFLIIQESGSRRIFDALCSDLYLQIRLYRYCSSSKPGRSLMALREHEDILRALQSRDRRKAEDAMRTHVANARQNLTWTPAQESAPSASASPSSQRRA